MMRRCAPVFLLFVVAAVFLGPPTWSSADATSLGGYQGTAAASGIHALYNPQGLLPLPPPVDLGSPDAYTTIATGPATFARASVADPGDLLASPDVLLGLAVPNYPSGTVPSYPYRVSAGSGVGEPRAESNPAPGLNARVSADPSESKAEAYMPAADAPAVATIGSVSAVATTQTDDTTVTVAARTKTSGINVLGLIAIDSIVTDLKATSVGSGTKLSGGTTVTGASVMGMPVTIDADGVHQKPGSNPTLPLGLGSLTGSLNDQLKQVGIRVTLAGPVKLAGSNSGQLGSTGLRIDFTFGADTVPGLVSLLDSLPPLDNPVPGAPVGPEDLIAAAKAHHLVSIEIGRGLVSLSARQAAVFDDAIVSSDDIALPDLALAPSFDLAPPVALTPGAPRRVIGGTKASAIPAATGVGALILLALLAAPLLGELIARGSGAVLAEDESEICTWEER